MHNLEEARMWGDDDEPGGYSFTRQVQTHFFFSRSLAVRGDNPNNTVFHFTLLSRRTTLIQEVLGWRVRQWVSSGSSKWMESLWKSLQERHSLFTTRETKKFDVLLCLFRWENEVPQILLLPLTEERESWQKQRSLENASQSWQFWDRKNVSLPVLSTYSLHQMAVNSMVNGKTSKHNFEGYNNNETEWWWHPYSRLNSILPSSFPMLFYAAS